MPGRQLSPGDYKYGFNGKELDDDGTGMGGGGSTYDYGFRIYNPQIAKFLSVDPLISSYPMLTPYQFANNYPIAAVDLDGQEAKIVISSKWFQSKIQNAINLNDFTEVERLTWAACKATFKNGDPVAVFTSDPNGNSGFMVFGEEISGGQFSVINRNVYSESGVYTKQSIIQKTSLEEMPKVKTFTARDEEFFETEPTYSNMDKLKEGGKRLFGFAKDEAIEKGLEKTAKKSQPLLVDPYEIQENQYKFLVQGILRTKGPGNQFVSPVYSAQKENQVIGIWSLKFVGMDDNENEIWEESYTSFTEERETESN
jgi:RHS repeat-associated protein